MFKIPGASLGTPMLGDAGRPLEELALDYVNGNTDNYFGFLKRTRGNDVYDGAYSKKTLEENKKMLEKK